MKTKNLIIQYQKILRVFEETYKVQGKYKKVQKVFMRKINEICKKIIKIDWSLKNIYKYK